MWGVVLDPMAVLTGTWLYDGLNPLEMEMLSPVSTTSLALLVIAGCLVQVGADVQKPRCHIFRIGGFGPSAEVWEM